jgi:hypothetical protein
MTIEKVQARIREDDTIIREHFEEVKKSDHPYEVRRLLEKAILIERKEKEILEEIQKQTGQDS